tara:strand:- start:737 stop:1540 length:804 start_codon:yes stop_codon:yes gene_type:complete
MLYKFEHLDQKLDALGYPKIEFGSGFRIIRGVDFEEAYKSGSISFEDDGIYLEYKGKKHRGYMFIQEAFITYKGRGEKFPKFHLRRCQTINEFISSGRFKQRYEWSNSNVNNLTDKQSKKKYKDVQLDICHFCKKDIYDEIYDTQDFFDSLDKDEIKENKIEVDIFGYTKDKAKVSKDYRERKNYTCEKCGVKPKSKLHKRWWHTHHVDTNKANNKLENLKCLCILCHSNVDQRHIENFSKKSMLKQIDFFNSEYVEELKLLNNPYL